MNQKFAPSAALILLAGDALTLALVTAYGFASHNTLDTAGLHMLTTYLPLVLAWLLIAPHFRVFEVERAMVLPELWRPFWAMLLAAPLAAWLRGMWLSTAIVPVFVVVLGGVAAVGLLVWRFIYLMVVSGFRRSHG